jgi:hypothetical protein
MVEKFLTNGHEAVGLTMLGKTAEMCIDKVKFAGSHECYLMADISLQQCSCSCIDLHVSHVMFADVVCNVRLLAA